MRNLFIKTTLVALAFSAAFSISAREQTDSGNHTDRCLRQSQRHTHRTYRKKLHS
jgi:hypothetical protein